MATVKERQNVLSIADYILDVEDVKEPTPRMREAAAYEKMRTRCMQYSIVSNIYTKLRAPGNEALYDDYQTIYAECTRETEKRRVIKELVKRFTGWNYSMVAQNIREMMPVFDYILSPFEDDRNVYTTGDRDAMYYEQRGLCACCGNTITDRKTAQIDHEFAFFLVGETLGEKNVRLVHKECNQHKGNLFISVEYHQGMTA